MLLSQAPIVNNPPFIGLVLTYQKVAKFLVIVVLLIMNGSTIRFEDFMAQEELIYMMVSRKKGSLRGDDFQTYITKKHFRH